MIRRFGVRQRHPAERYGAALVRDIREKVGKSPLKIHGDVTWAIDWDAAAMLADLVGDEDRTVETGAGLSTIIFTSHGCCHLAITPNEKEATSLRDWLKDNSIPQERLQFDHRVSWQAAPEYTDTEWDAVLIDGCHGFPVPFVDFFYLGRQLRIGGLLAVDDTQLWTGKVLKQFLAEDDNWATIGSTGKTAFFRKTGEPAWYEWEWVCQPYVVKRSRRLSDRLGQQFASARRLSTYVAKGDWRRIARAVRSRLRH